MRTNMASVTAVIAPLLNGVLLILAVFTAVNPKDCNEPDKVDMFDVCVSEEGDKTPIGSYFGKSKLSACHDSKSRDSDRPLLLEL